ncbi:hypothetical protein THAOC_24111 [Thalassiosira oceanica]|uniref:Hsp90 chaperone protein kinase-targeting subunit n=1 Tax=Thalassiosira oceanica TaxID=159749 RepID=K0S571_THAOC|nr:hypothetical protein THAOC_24111 [Thalassiosira oceanica]|mmetsp:Transcript_34898/g.83439  ORF Transcript_34898/g.83439 Transcript_34898/m.83439 type:complete len:459 (-) Transcript_34898:63-1439(-)|eukprot:EJK56071.1 hypothetical protein THAOC_24111 [Thalassiosira oceanica]
MSKPFDYSKWDNIELSDDEDDVHPNIDRESWFRLKHRSRVEREEKEDKDKKRIQDENAKANLRIKEINKILSKSASVGEGSDSDSDDDLEDLEGLRAELKALEDSITDNQAKLDHYEKNKKWNVDNMCNVVEERTIVNANVKESKFSDAGYALPTEAEQAAAQAAAEKQMEKKSQAGSRESSGNKTGIPTEKLSKAKLEDSKKAEDPATSKKDPVAVSKSSESSASALSAKSPQLHPQPDSELSVSVAMLSYHEFTQKYADTVEEFMSIESLDKSRDFLLNNGDVLLQENASNYLLLASLEDEMNGLHQKMKLVARQSQIISNIAELAKSLKTHPGNVIHPFFQRLQNKELYDGFMDGVNQFIQRVEVRAVQKRKEMDEERAREAGEPVDVSEIPREERLGPGGLDPMEVFETLPEAMQEAFESREKDKLEAALQAMSPDEASYHLQRCIDCGLWNSG